MSFIGSQGGGTIIIEAPGDEELEARIDAFQARRKTVTYYVDFVNGDNLDDGLEPWKAKKDITGVNALVLGEGDEVKFLSGLGQIYNDARLDSVSDKVTYSADGPGLKPIIGPVVNAVKNDGSDGTAWGLLAGTTYVWKKRVDQVGVRPVRMAFTRIGATSHGYGWYRAAALTDLDVDLKGTAGVTWSRLNTIAGATSKTYCYSRAWPTFTATRNLDEVIFDGQPSLHRSDAQTWMTTNREFWCSHVSTLPIVVYSSAGSGASKDAADPATNYATIRGGSKWFAEQVGTAVNAVTNTLTFSLNAGTTRIARASGSWTNYRVDDLVQLDGIAGVTTGTQARVIAASGANLDLNVDLGTTGAKVAGTVTVKSVTIYVMAEQRPDLIYDEVLMCQQRTSGLGGACVNIKHMDLIFENLCLSGGNNPTSGSNIIFNQPSGNAKRTTWRSCEIKWSTESGLRTDLASDVERSIITGTEYNPSEVSENGDAGGQIANGILIGSGSADNKNNQLTIEYTKINDNGTDGVTINSLGKCHIDMFRVQVKGNCENPADFKNHSSFRAMETSFVAYDNLEIQGAGNEALTMQQYSRGELIDCEAYAHRGTFSAAGSGKTAIKRDPKCTLRMRRTLVYSNSHGAFGQGKNATDTVGGSGGRDGRTEADSCIFVSEDTNLVAAVDINFGDFIARHPIIWNRTTGATKSCVRLGGSTARKQWNQEVAIYNGILMNDATGVSPIADRSALTTETNRIMRIVNCVGYKRGSGTEFAREATSGTTYTQSQWDADVNSNGLIITTDDRENGTDKTRKPLHTNPFKGGYGGTRRDCVNFWDRGCVGDFRLGGVVHAINVSAFGTDRIPTPGEYMVGVTSGATFWVRNVYNAAGVTMLLVSELTGTPVDTEVFLGDWGSKVTVANKSTPAALWNGTPHSEALYLYTLDWTAQATAFGVPGSVVTNGTHSAFIEEMTASGTTGIMYIAAPASETFAGAGTITGDQTTAGDGLASRTIVAGRSRSVAVFNSPLASNNSNEMQDYNGEIFSSGDNYRHHREMDSTNMLRKDGAVLRLRRNLTGVTLTTGSPTVTNMTTNTLSYVPGTEIIHPDITPGTTVLSVNEAANTLLMSADLVGPGGTNQTVEVGGTGSLLDDFNVGDWIFTEDFNATVDATIAKISALADQQITLATDPSATNVTTPSAGAMIQLYGMVETGPFRREAAYVA